MRSRPNMLELDIKVLALFNLILVFALHLTDFPLHAPGVTVDVTN